MKLHEVPTKPKQRPVKVIKRDERPKPEPMDDDLRRLCLSLFHLLRRRHPEDFRLLAAEIDRRAA